MKSMGDFILGFVVGVLVTLGVLGGLLMVQTRNATRQAEAARMEAEMQRLRAEEAVQEALEHRRRPGEERLKGEKLKMPRVDDERPAADK
jgi:hypothetical protein